MPPGQEPYPALKPEDEWAFVMQTVRTYTRAGCAALALDLGTWLRYYNGAKVRLMVFQYNHGASYLRQYLK